MIAIAVVASLWLLALIFCVALARAARRGDEMAARARLIELRRQYERRGP